MVALIRLLLRNKSHSMQRYDNWFSEHPLCCGSWGIAGNTPLALGYLGVSWGGTDVGRHSQDWGTRASVMLSQLCSLNATGTEITVRRGPLGIISPKHLPVSSPRGSDSCAPRASSELHVPVGCLRSSSSLRSHEISLLPHPLGNQRAMHDRVSSTP